MKSIYLRWPGCGGFDAVMGDVNVSFDPYLFGEHLDLAEPIFDYIFISHEHFEHAHPVTLKKLCQGPRFKKLFVPIGCITPNSPVDEKYGDAATARDLPITKHIPEDKVQVCYPKYQDEEQYGKRDFPGPFEFDLGPIKAEVYESGEHARDDLPTCAYHVYHEEKDLGIFHTGDLHRGYAQMERLRGKVDFLVHMKTAMGPLIAAVRPQYVIPTHYRTDRETEPVPFGHWPPNVSDANAFLESLREQIPGDTQMLPFTAPNVYEVKMPEKKVNWSFVQWNSWDRPRWRPPYFQSHYEE